MLRLATQRCRNGLADPIVSCNMDEVSWPDTFNWDSRFEREESFIGLKVFQDKFRRRLQLNHGWSSSRAFCSRGHMVSKNKE